MKNDFKPVVGHCSIFRSGADGVLDYEFSRSSRTGR